jgi:hypothetical protein
VKFAIVANNARKKTSSTPQEKADAKRTHLAQQRAIGNFDGAVGGKERLARLDQEELSSAPPTSRSRSAICSLMADWETWSWRPASLKVP